VRVEDVAVRCEGCARVYPVVGGVPILLAEERSVFSIAEAKQGAPQPTPLGRALGKVLPSLGLNRVSAKNFARLREALQQQAPQREGRAARVLLVGAGDRGAGVAELHGTPGLELVESDILLSPAVKLVADAHDLPFEGESFDAVVLQAVLEHVVDPVRCVAEAHRVLQPGGYIYTEVPFLQQVHMGAHDFTRFTLGGHRALLRSFRELDAGAAGGPAMALGWAIDHFFRSFSSAPLYRKALAVGLPLALFWLKYLDLVLEREPQAADAASGTFFFGVRSEAPATDREILARYGRSPR
jgi:SAM-dependent methyltransferase